MLENPSIFVHQGDPLYDQQCLILLPESFLCTCRCPTAPGCVCMCVHVCVVGGEGACVWWGRKLYLVQTGQQWYHMTENLRSVSHPPMHQLWTSLFPLKWWKCGKAEDKFCHTANCTSTFLRAEIECYQQSLRFPSPGTWWNFWSFLLYSAGTVPGAYSSSDRA